MTDRDTLIELAERVEKADDFTCPLCGETGFDAPGFIFSHDHFCEVRRACVGAVANNNAEVAAALRALASTQE